MVARTSAAFVVMLSLAAPPLVGIVCGFLCESGSHHPVAAAGHHHHATHDGDQADPAGVQTLVGDHVCDHGLGVVDVYGPSGASRSPLPVVTVVIAAPPATAVPYSLVAPWSQPLERVLGPPTRSPVLRI